MRRCVRWPDGLVRISSIAALALICAGCGSTAARMSASSAVVAGHFPRQHGGGQRAQQARLPVAMGFFDARHGVMSTAGDGTLLTADGGRSWHRGPRLALRSIDAVSSSVGYATTANRLLRTDDGGRHWHVVARVGGTPSFSDPLHGWIVGRRVWATDDGGRTVRRLRVPCRPGPAGTRALSRVTATLGFAACAGEPGAGQQLKTLYLTDDAGRSWKRAPGAHLSSMGYLSSIAFISRRVGLMTTERGGLSVTRDGGRSWRTLLQTDDTTDVAALARLNAQRLIVLLGDGTLLRSADAGAHWQTVYPGGVPQPWTVSFSSPAGGVGLGRASLDPLGPVELLATVDGGRSWQVRSRRSDLLKLDRASGTVIYAISTSYRSLLRSEDDGRTWHAVATPGAVRDIAWVSFSSPRVGLLLSGSGRIYSTDDGGAGWRLVGRRRGLDSPQLLTSTRGLAIYGPPAPQPTLRNPKPRGPAPVLEQTLDGGRSWHPYAVPGLHHAPIALATLPPSTIWIFERRGRGRYAVETTRDGGRHWRRIDYARLPSYGNLDLVTPRLAYMWGNPGYRTSDGGREWRLVGSGS